MKTCGSKLIVQFLTRAEFIALGLLVFSLNVNAVQGTNHALNKAATASSSYSGSSQFSIAQGNDGDANTRWNGGTHDAWWQVDLGSSFYIDQIFISSADGPGYHITFQVSSSPDNINWTPIGAQTTGSGASWSFTFDAGGAGMRYIRYTTTYTSGGSGSDWATLGELQAIGNSLPTASALSISGAAQAGQVLTGSYGYADAESDAQNVSGTGTSYRFVRSTDNSVASAGDNTDVANGVTGGIDTTYTVQAADVGSYLFYCVTPSAIIGNSPGVEVCSSAAMSSIPQAITAFAPTTPVVFGAAPATLSATGGVSDSPVVFATTSAGTICTVVGTQLTYVGIGVCNLTANQAGGGSYSAASEVTASVTINAAAQAITSFTPASPVIFGAAPATLSATGGASGNPVVFATTSAGTICTVVGTTLTYIGVGVCNLTANQAAGGNYGAAPQVTASVTINAAPVKSYTGTSPTGHGTITGAFTGGNETCAYATSQFTTSATAPAGITLTYGVFNFTTNDCGSGNTLNFTITYPQNLPAGTRYYKFGPEFGGSQTPHWYALPGAVVSGNQISFSITDNGVGDSNPAAGLITDPGGPGVPDGSAANAIPTLSEWGLIILAGLMALFAMGQLSRVRRR